MSKSSCPWCNHSNVTAEGRNHYCNYCGHEWQYKPTVFDQITASPDVLAERLVYLVRSSYNGATNYYWRSTVVDAAWKTKTEAIAATVERLKEVAYEQ